MDENGISFIQQLRKLRQCCNQALVNFAFGVIPVWDRNPDPFEACSLGLVPDSFRAFAFLQQSDDVCAAERFQLRKKMTAWPMEKCQASVSDFYELHLRWLRHFEFSISAMCNTFWLFLWRFNPP